MSSTIFEESNYLDRFIKNQSKRIKLPNFKYIGAKLHPKYKDHVVVLSKNEFPSDTKMTPSWDANIYGLSDLDTKWGDAFNKHVDIVWKKHKQAQDKSSSKNGDGNKLDAFKKKDTSVDKSTTLNKADELLEETKGLGIVSDEDSYDYSGGESDEGEQANKDSKKDDEEDKSVTDLEKDVEDIIAGKGKDSKSDKADSVKSKDELNDQADKSDSKSKEETKDKQSDDSASQRSEKKDEKPEGKKESKEEKKNPFEDSDSEADLKETKKGDEDKKESDDNAPSEHNHEKTTVTPEDEEEKSNKNNEENEDEDMPHIDKFKAMTQKEKQEVVNSCVDE